MQVLQQIQWNPRTYPTGLHQNKKRTKGKIVCNKIFEEETESLKEIADEIIKIEECLKEQQLHNMSSSNRSEPPGWPGRMHKYYILPGTAVVNANY